MQSVPAFSSKNVLHLPHPVIVARQLTRQRNKRVSVQKNSFEELLATWGLKITSPVQILPGAIRNETWRVTTNMGRMVLKRYKAALEYDQILHEHSILNYLKQVDYSAPRLAINLEGDTIVQFDGRYYALFEFLEGYFKYGDYVYFPDQLRYFLFAEGRVLASLHEVLKNFNPQGYNLNGFQSKEGGRWRDLDWYLEKLTNATDQAISVPKEKSHPVNTMLLAKTGWIEDELRRVDSLLTEANLERRIVHGDFRPYNLMVKPGKPIVVLDFELARMDWRLFDIMSLLSTTTQMNRRPHDDPRIVTVMKGYQSVQPLPAEELMLLPQLMRWQGLRRMIICWERYFQFGDYSWLEEARHRIDGQQWINDHQKALSTIHERIQ